MVIGRSSEDATDDLRLGFDWRRRIEQVIEDARSGDTLTGSEIRELAAQERQLEARAIGLRLDERI
jgi:hypothetical protein